MSKTMLDVSRSPSKKQIRTSKISVFIVLAGQMRNSQHWRGYQQAPSQLAGLPTSMHFRFYSPSLKGIRSEGNKI